MGTSRDTCCSVCWAVTVALAVSAARRRLSFATVFNGVGEGVSAFVDHDVVRLWCSSARGRHHWHTRFD